jgi:hypothetical protein
MQLKRANNTKGPRTLFYAYEDFVNNINSPFFISSGNGTGNTLSTLGVFDATGIGISTLNQGTQTTGRSGVTSNNQTLLYFSSSVAWSYEARFYLPTISNNATEGFKIFAGFMDTLPTSGAESVDGAWIAYTDNENGGRWELVTSNNSSRTRVDSGVTVAINTWYTLRVVVQPISGTLTAQYFINGSPVGNITTNLPITSARSTGYGAHNAKITDVPVYIDYVEVKADIAAGR